MKTVLIKILAKLLGGHEEWSVQCADHQGCFRLWTNGLPDRQSALNQMRLHVDEEVLIDGQTGSRWRVECCISFSTYEEDKK